MIWWRGNGLWIGVFAFLPAVAAMKIGATNVSIAYGASAALIYLIKGAFTPGSSLFSVPTEYWPPLLLFIALLVQFSPSKPFSASNPKIDIVGLQASLSRMLGKQIRFDRADYANSTLHFYVTSMDSFDNVDAKQAAFDRQVREHYCENAKALWQANVGMVIRLSAPPRSLNDRVRIHILTLSPQECKSRFG